MRKQKKSRKKIAVPLATGIAMATIAFVGLDTDKAFAAGSQTPELTSYQNGNAVKLEWSTDILDSSVLFSSGFEDGQTIPGFWWSMTDWNTGITTNTEGNQKITTVDKRSGSKAYNVANTSTLGNYYGKSIAGWGRFFYANGTPLSITFYAKTDGSASIFPLGDGGWGKNFYNIQGISVAQSAPAGQNKIKVNSVNGISPGNLITSDTDVNTVKDMYQITAVDSATNTLTLNYNLTRTMNPGEQLKSRYWRDAWRFESRSFTSADGWKRFSINTSVLNNADYDVSQSGGQLYFINEAIGNLYIDDVKFGYATQAVLYRDGSQIYSGYLSDYNDTSATDKAVPNAVKNVVVTMSGNKPVISWGASTDNGTNYNYSIKGVSVSGESPVSNPNSVTVTTGIKGYSVVVDQNPNTIPDAIIETTTPSFTSPSVVNNNFYVHVVAVDNAGNVSAPVHMSYTDTIAPTLNLSASTTSPTNQDVVLTATALDDETGVKRIQKPDGTWVTGATATYNATANGTYNFIVEDNAGNQTTKSIAVSNIDKVLPTLGSVSDPQYVNGNSVRVWAFGVGDANSGVDQVTVYAVHPDSSYYYLGTATKDGETNNYYYDVTDINIDGNWHYDFRVFDKAGNVLGPIGAYVTRDVVAPALATFNPDKTVPTNTSVAVTVNYPADGSVREVRINGGAWTTYTAPVRMTANGKIEARSTDAAGNVSAIASFDVTNIDKVVPVDATFSADKTSSTNQNVSVTIIYPSDSEVKEYRINGGTWMAYTAPVLMNENGTIDARSFDEAGNVSNITTYSVSNIDKVAPTAPSISIDGNNIRVSAGTDSESGATETLIKINDGEWVKYTGEIKLPDGQYTISVKSVDEAGNESPIVTKEFFAYDVALDQATIAVEDAEASVTQEKTDLAKSLVNLLPTGDSKEALIERLIQVQGKIDGSNIQKRIDDIISALSSGNVTLIMLDDLMDELDQLLEKTNALPAGFDKESIEGKLSQLQNDAKLSQDVLSLTEGASIDDIKNLADLVNSLPDGALKDQLQERLDAVDVIKNATELVEALEGSLSKNDLENAKRVVGNLPNSSAKTELLGRIEVAENKIVAQDAVSKVENTLSKADYDKAVLALEKLPESDLKESLKHQLEDVKQKIDAITLVEKAEKTKAQSDVNEGRKAVARLADGKLKDDLNFRLDRYDTDLRNAISKVKTAETFITASSIKDAKTAVENLIESPQKEELKSRISVLEMKLSDKSLQDQIAKATAKVIQAEQYKRDPYVGDAYDLVGDLPDGDVKDALFARLDALGLLNSSTLDKELLAKINVIQDTKKRSILLDVLRSIQRAEKHSSKGNIVYALRKVDNIPAVYRQDADSLTIVTELTDRANTLKTKFNSELEAKQEQEAIDRADQYVQMYERNKLETYKKAAQQAIDALPAGEVKESLQARVNAVVK